MTEVEETEKEETKEETEEGSAKQDELIWLICLSSSIIVVEL